jgi:cell division control protein 6
MNEMSHQNNTSQNVIFHNPSMLAEDVIPRRIQHREKQMQSVSYYLSGLVRYGMLQNNVLIYGPPGTGKTHSIRRAAKNLDRRVSSFYGRAFKSISCHSFFRSFLKRNFKIDLHPRESLSVYYSAFEKATSDMKNILVVFDDIQYLLAEDPKGFDGLLSYLSRLEKNLGLILIGNIRVNDLSLALDPPTTSSLKLRSVYFPKYNASELKDILMERAREALTKSAFQRSQGSIAWIAAHTAQSWGSARYALDILKEAGMVSEVLLDKGYIPQEAVEQAVKMLEVNSYEAQVRDLPQQALAVLDAVYRQKEKKSLSTGDVYSAYEKVCCDKGLSAFTLRKVSDMITELDSAGLISCRLVSKGRFGRTRLITWSSNPALEKVYEMEREGV